jgi:thiol-disulfide isomerase/thioredoxin
MSKPPPYPHRKTLFIGGGAAVLGVLIIATFMWMVGPAAAREVDSACGSLRSAEPKPVLCPSGQPCSLPVVAPDFTAQTHDGKPVRLSDYRGKVILLNFWASWCAVCKTEKPSLGSITHDLASDDFVVITLASDRKWTEVLHSLMASLAPSKLDPNLPTDASLAQTLDAYRKILPEGTPFHVFLDPPASEDTQIGQIATRWGVAAVPESFVIDKAGRVRFYFDNSRDWNLSVAHTCLRSIIDE